MSTNPIDDIKKAEEAARDRIQRAELKQDALLQKLDRAKQFALDTLEDTLASETGQIERASLAQVKNATESVAAETARQEALLRGVSDDILQNGARLVVDRIMHSV